MRKARSYKISDETYFAAMDKAKEKGEQLATIIEAFVTSYSIGIFEVKSITEKEKPKVIESNIDEKFIAKANKAGSKIDYTPFKPSYADSPKFTIVNGKKVFK